MNTFFKHLISSAFLTAGLALSGCGTDVSPVASTDAASPQDAGLSFIHITAPGQQAAAKIADLPLIDSVTQVFDAQGGAFGIELPTTPTPLDDIAFDFVVPQNGLDHAETITMSILGTDFSNLVAAFDPSGLVFLQAANLRVTIGKALTDATQQELEDMTIYHEHHDGTVEIATHWVEQTGAQWIIVIEVPGFSRYSGGGGV